MSANSGISYSRVGMFMGASLEIVVDTPGVGADSMRRILPHTVVMDEHQSV